MAIAKLLVASLFVLCFFYLPMFGQSSPEENRSGRFWARFGAGVAGLDRDFGFGGIIGVQYSSQLGLIGMRYLNSTKTGVEPATVAQTRLSDISELSATWGLSTNISLLQFSASGGLGVVWGTEKTSSNDQRFTRIALPLEAGITFRLLPVVAVGTLLSATLSPKNTVINPMIVIHIGKLK